MTGDWLAAVMLVLLAVAHSGLGEVGILRPLFAQDWNTGEPRWAIERVLRFAWHLTSFAWIALAAIVVGVAALPAVVVLGLASAAVVFVVLRGHMAWPLFLLVALGAARAEGWLTDDLLRVGALAAVVILLAASALHGYWALGGSWLFDLAVPTSPEGEPTFRPGRLLTAVVAVALACFAALLGLVVADSGPSGTRLLAWAGVVVLAVRAFGDTRTAGFTKTDHTSRFAEADDRWFTPAVVFIALGATGAVLAS